MIKDRSTHDVMLRHLSFVVYPWRIAWCSQMCIFILWRLDVIIRPALTLPSLNSCATIPIVTNILVIGILDMVRCGRALHPAVRFKRKISLVRLFSLFKLVHFPIIIGFLIRIFNMLYRFLALSRLRRGNHRLGKLMITYGSIVGIPVRR